MSWTQLLGNKDAQKHTASKQELDNMRELISRDLADAAVTRLSADRRFAIAYNNRGKGDHDESDGILRARRNLDLQKSSSVREMETMTSPLLTAKSRGPTKQVRATPTLWWCPYLWLCSWRQLCHDFMFFKAFSKVSSERCGKQKFNLEVHACSPRVNSDRSLSPDVPRFPAAVLLGEFVFAFGLHRRHTIRGSLSRVGALALQALELARTTGEAPLACCALEHPVLQGG